MKNITKKDILKILNIYQNHINDFVNISQRDIDRVHFNFFKDIDIKQTKELNNTQLELTSQYINENYNLDTWVNEETKTISLSVWTKELTDSYDIEMSKEQSHDFYEEYKIHQKEINIINEKI